MDLRSFSGRQLMDSIRCSTIIFSAYGMNVNPAGMPFATSPAGFAIILAIAAGISAVIGFVLAKLNMLR